MRYLVNDPNLSENIYNQLTNTYTGFKGLLNPSTGEFIFDAECYNQSFFNNQTDKETWVPFYVTRYRNDDMDRGVWFKPALPANHPNKKQLDDMLNTITGAINQYDNIRHAKSEAAKNNFCTEVVLADHTMQEELLNNKLKKDREYLYHLVKVVQTALKDALPGMLSPFIDVVASYMIKPFIKNESAGSIILFKEPEQMKKRQLEIQLEKEERERQNVGAWMDMYPSTG